MALRRCEHGRAFGCLICLEESERRRDEIMEREIIMNGQMIHDEHGPAAPDPMAELIRAANRTNGETPKGETPRAPDRKPSNPKDRLGILKVCFSVIPIPVLWELGLAMLEGALKYGRHNYRVIGVRASVYYDATVARHLASWWEGEDIDPKSGVHHITKAIASLVVLRDAMIRGNWIDDRPPATDPQLIEDMNEKVAKLLEMYPTPVEAYTEANKNEERAPLV
jgi:hypothetical protein